MNSLEINSSAHSVDVQAHCISALRLIGVESGQPWATDELQSVFLRIVAPAWWFKLDRNSLESTAYGAREHGGPAHAEEDQGLGDN